ncbi:hypothetical protein RvY_06860-1 [Ramazzottius varieornatus]|uniref:Amino acid permease/ SLC12A domain-containing protein n=1 Tax=Ramazzottius varieornatus TaxID=947166 RepID=A0A1D1V0F5_RAMVA|nr:hypothetical protein RvY_06860-1 [Ramazzottius varieornatus]
MESSLGGNACDGSNGVSDHEKPLDFVTSSSATSLNVKTEMVVSTISGSPSTDVTAVSVTTTSKVQLKRKIGLVSCVGIVVGSMIGSGIFIAPKLVLRGSGSVGIFLLIWFITGVLSLCGGLCFIELGCLIPKSGGEYTYLMEAYGPLHQFFGPLPAFLYSYTRNLAASPSSFAVGSLSFGMYCAQPFYADGEVPQWLPKVLAAGCIVMVAVINSTSVRLSLWMQNTFAAVKVIALVVLIVAGLVRLGQGHTENLATGFTPFDNVTSLANVASAIYSCFWTYAGWSSLNVSLEEVYRPSLNLPRAISFAIPLVTVLYIMANVAYLTVMTPLEILTSNAVAVTFANRVLGVMAWIVPFSVACSTFGGATGSSFSAARVFHASARQGHMVKAFSYISISRSTPFPPILLQASIALLMIAVGGITSLIDYMSFITWFFLALSFMGKKSSVSDDTGLV